MPSYPTAVHRIGPVVEPAVRQEVEEGWLRTFVILHCALLIPYITDLIPALYGIGVFPLRPALFMLALCALNAAWILFKGPDFTKTFVFLAGLLAWRLIDIGLLQRYLFPDGQKEALFSSIALLLMTVIIAGSLGVLRKTTLKPVLLVAGLSIVVQAASVLLEFAGFVSFSTVDGRAAGFASDANDSCMMMTLMLGVFLTLNRGFWLNLALVAITGIGVLPTLSRGGMLSLALIVAVFTLLNLRRHGPKLLIAGAAFFPVAAGIVGMLMNNADSGGVVDKNARKRIEAIFGGDIGEMGSGERFKDLTDGIEGAMIQPLTGLGTGAGQLLYQPHNQLVTLWIDLGIFGPIAYLLLLGIAALKVLGARGRGIYILLPLCLYVFLAQTLLDNYAYLYAWLVLLFVTSNRFFTLRLTRPRPAAP